MADTEAANEAELDLKKRARRRLVGASALALTAAIVLPMVMDREPRPPVQDIQIRIPNQDGTGFTSRIVPGKSASTSLPSAEPRPAPAELKHETAVKAAPAPVAKVEPPKTEPAKTEAPKPVEAKPGDKSTVEKPAAKPAEKTPEKVVEKPAEKASEKMAEKKDEARAAAALSGSSSEQWIVQLGAYKEVGNVKLLLAKIKQMGLPAYTEPFDSPQGARTRVRAGPFASKEAAERAKARIKSIGVDGPVAPK